MTVALQEFLGPTKKTRYIGFIKNCAQTVISGCQQTFPHNLAVSPCRQFNALHVAPSLPFVLLHGAAVFFVEGESSVLVRGRQTASL